MEKKGMSQALIPPPPQSWALAPLPCPPHRLSECPSEAGRHPQPLRPLQGGKEAGNRGGPRGIVWES